ncbi:hypothetical protein F5Y17DRAFT_343575 [Xylariaceae sp. FL0594]|nr:hypothetical protein F5Y17DRAFT_343575 [Xylariaceae sp. FL0594]
MDDYDYGSRMYSQGERIAMSSLVSPPRNGRQNASQELRTALPRRFTTDSGRVPTLSSIMTSQSLELPVLEKKKLEYEQVRERKRQFERAMQSLDQKQRELQEDLAPMLALTGHQSEPTTPPEYRFQDPNGFPTIFSRPNRYSMSSLMSPPGLLNRPGRSGSQLTSPQSTIPARYNDEQTYHSVPITRRNSDDQEREEALRQDPTSHLSSKR